MRVLGIHTDGFEMKANQKALSGVADLADENRRVSTDDDCLVVYVSVEQTDEKNTRSVARQLADSTAERARLLGTGKIMLYPYVHLCDNPARPMTAQRTLTEAMEYLRMDFDVTTVPFGWYKSFSIHCTGHPLSEWSARFSPKEETEKPPPRASEHRSPSEFVRWLCIDLEGNEHEVTPENFGQADIFKNHGDAYSLLKQFVKNELAGSADNGNGSIPKHIRYMQSHELIDYCDVSEKGHLKWYPRGVLIFQLFTDYARNLAHSWGAMEMKNPILIRGNANTVGELMGEFHERDYQVDGGRGICYLRYASDPLGFPFMQNVRFSHHQGPLKVYEEANCFRNEQEGEVSGLKRVRHFLMTDMHAACTSVQQAEYEFEHLSMMFAGLMNDFIAGDRWILGWEGTVDFYKENRDYLIGISKKLGVPSFFKLMNKMSHYYAIKSEFQSIAEDGSNIQVSTVQWDVKDGPRFNIGYTDESGEKVPCPVIVHASSFGSIERTVCTLLENIAIDEKRGVPPMLPYWLSPTQVRLIPVSSNYNELCMEISGRISGIPARCDVDDRNETVGKKIRNAEKDWIPYAIVIGEREAEGAAFTVRIRKPRSQQAMSFEELSKELAEQQDSLPFRPLPTQVRVSANPIFYG